MKEILFIKKNEPNWKQFEGFLKGKEEVPVDQLTNLYLQLTDDLSYARTFYPKSPIVDYLNNLSMLAHQKIYKNKKEKKSRFRDFWIYEVPLAVKRAHKELLYATIIFCVSIAIGLFSMQQNPEFVRSILGDVYVNITEDNIANEDPLAIYKSSGQGNMFVGISSNNIRVSFLVYAFGLLGSIPAAYILLTNGIMVGAFIGFFIEKGLGGIAFTTIMIHGTLELAAIIIAGGAGLVLGNSLLFPGTYSRSESLIRGARSSLKIIIGLVPVFLIAGFLESFVTRHYISLGNIGRSIIVFLSFCFIVYYFIIYPYRISENEYDSRQI